MVHTLFELDYGYNPWISFKDKYKAYSKSTLANELTMELRELINICRQNSLHTQDFQKQVYNKGMKPWSYEPDKKVWLNSKHIKTKQN